jgi:GNAT superfamily N-acetyltransferase
MRLSSPPPANTAPEAIPPVEVRRATEADLDILQAFVGKTYGTGAVFKGPDRWRWQFLRSPFRPCGDFGPSVWIATSGERVVGQIATQDTRLRLDGQDLHAGWIVDVMVDPAFRGIGLSHRIHEAVLRDRALLVTLTMAPATRRVAERAGCVTLGPTGQFILPHRLRASSVRRYLGYKAQQRPELARVLGAFCTAGIGPAAVSGAARAVTAARRLSRPRSALRDFRVEEIHRFSEASDGFWQTAAADFPAIFDRSAAFLNWRFCDSPGLIYRCFLIYGGKGELRGHLVTRVALSAELPAGIIADAFTRREDDEALDALLTLAQDVLARDTEYLEAAASTPTSVAALNRAGFLRTRTMRPTVVARDPTVRARIAAMSNDWHLTKADHDWDQVHPV